MRWQHPIVLFVGLCGAGWGFLYRLFPLLEENPLLDLVAPPRVFLQTGFETWFFAAFRSVVVLDDGRVPSPVGLQVTQYGSSAGNPKPKSFDSPSETQPVVLQVTGIVSQQRLSKNGRRGCGGLRSGRVESSPRWQYHTSTVLGWDLCLTRKFWHPLSLAP